MQSRRSFIKKTAGLVLAPYLSLGLFKRDFRGQSVLDLRKFGLKEGWHVSGSDRLANFDRWREILTEVLPQEQLPLLVPAGDWRIDVRSDRPAYAAFSRELYGAAVDSSCRIVGEGMEKSRLKFGPERPPFGYAALLRKAGHTLSVQDLTLEGPDNPWKEGVTRADHNALTYGVYGRGHDPEDQQDKKGLMVFQRARIGGLFATAIAGTAGDDTLVLEDVRGQAHVNFCSFFSSMNGRKKQIIASRVTVERSGIWNAVNGSTKVTGEPDSPSGMGRDYGAGFYLHPNVSVRIQDLHFHRTARVCFKHYSGRSVTEGPEFLEVDGIWVHETCGGGIMTPNYRPRDGRAVYRDVHLLHQAGGSHNFPGFKVRCDTLIEGGDFNVRSDVDERHISFYDDASSSSTEGIKLEIGGRCTFRRAATASVSVGRLKNRGDSELVVGSGATFLGPFNDMAVYVRWPAASIKMEGTQFACPAHYGIMFTSAESVHLKDVLFNMPSGAAQLALSRGATFPGGFRLDGCSFKGKVPPIKDHGAKTRIVRT